MDTSAAALLEPVGLDGIEIAERISPLNGSLSESLGLPKVNWKDAMISKTSPKKSVKPAITPTKIEKKPEVSTKLGNIDEMLVSCVDCGGKTQVKFIVDGKCKKCLNKPATEAAKKSAPKTDTKIVKIAKTILKDGLHYSLLSRVRNAYTPEQQKKLESGKKPLELVDGRGQSQTISSCYQQIANKLGGAKYLSSVRTSGVRKALKESGDIA